MLIFLNKDRKKNGMYGGVRTDARCLMPKKGVGREAAGVRQNFTIDFPAPLAPRPLPLHFLEKRHWDFENQILIKPIDTNYYPVFRSDPD